MSKYDALLQKTAAFEKLALYSDRKVFLSALAQSHDLDINSIRRNFVNLVYSFWRQHPQEFPINAREAISPLAYPQSQLDPQELKQGMVNVYKILANSGNDLAVAFATNQVMAAIEALEKAMQNVPNIPPPSL